MQNTDFFNFWQFRLIDLSFIFPSTQVSVSAIKRNQRTDFIIFAASCEPLVGIDA